MSTKECPICCDDIPIANFTITATKCNHSVCRTCLLRQMNHQLNRKGTTNIECLDGSCKNKMEYEDIKRVGDRDLFER
jgi:hypothetical protein